MIANLSIFEMFELEVVDGIAKSDIRLVFLNRISCFAFHPCVKYSSDTKMAVCLPEGSYRGHDDGEKC